MEASQAYAAGVERLRAMRRPEDETRRSTVDRAVGLLAGRVGCRLEEAGAQLSRIATEQGRELGDVAAGVISLLEERGAPPATAATTVADVRVALRTRAPMGLPLETGAPVADLGPTVQAVLDTLPGSVAFLTPVRNADGEVVDFVIEAASPEAADVSGRRGGQMVGLRVTESYPEMVDGDIWQAYHRVLASGQPVEVGPAPYSADVGMPVEARFSARVHQVGHGVMVTWVRHDEQARHDVRIAQTEQLGNLGWGEWDLVSGRIEWSDQLYRIYERDRALGPLTNDESDAMTLPEDREVVAAAGEAFLRGERFDATYRVRVNGKVKYVRAVVDAVRDANGQPLKLYGIVQDVTTREATRARLDEVERRLAEQQRTLEAEHRLAAELQHIILPIPEEPVDLPGLRVAVRYLPAEDLGRVGGDWYHAAALPDGTVLLAIGDVAGHGLPAATAMAQLRHALRALAVTTTAPAALLGTLNRLMCDLADASAPTPTASTATAIVAIFDPRDRSLVWAQAGHPPPFLVRGGATTPLPRPEGALLGVRPDVPYATARLVLDPSDVLLFYTDGLIENRTQTPEEGQRLVVETLNDVISSNPGQPLAALIARLRRANPEDDTCILAVRPFTPGGAGATSSANRGQRRGQR